MAGIQIKIKEPTTKVTLVNEEVCQIGEVNGRGERSLYRKSMTMLKGKFNKIEVGEPMEITVGTGGMITPAVKSIG